MKTKSKSFTLIELLVVIAIIGILASIVLFSVTGMQARGRDTQRRADVASIANAMLLYYNENKTFVLTGCGSNDTGRGYYNIVRATAPIYNKSIAAYLFEKHYIDTDKTRDPLCQDNTPDDYVCTSTPKNLDYYINATASELAVYAHLENPTTNEIADFTAAKVPPAAPGIGALGVPTPGYNYNYILRIRK